MRKLAVLPVFALAALRVFGQGTVIYDQQSAVEGASSESGGIITTSQPFGQSFTPTFSSVGFIRLWVSDLAGGNGIGSTVSVNLRAGSITGPILTSTDPVFLPDAFGNGPGNRGYPDFFFSTPATVTPGATYYFQPVLLSGDALLVFGDSTYG